MELTLTNFEDWYNATFATPFTGETEEVSFLLDMYLEEIKLVLPLETEDITKIYNFDGCNEFYLACPVWENYTVKIGEKSKPLELTNLTINKDFTEQHSNLDENKVIGLDFSCLRCNCKCEFVQIQGTFGYTLPDLLVKLIFKLVTGLVSTESCDCDENGKILTSIKTGSINKIYTLINPTKADNLQNLKQGYDILEYPPVKNYLRRYKIELIKI
jgi:hypothetical protein